MKAMGIAVGVLTVLFMAGCVQAQKGEEMKKENVVLETNAGVIEVALYDDVAPKACENFRGLVKKGYYNGIIFHRVIKNFMIQGGDPTGTGRGGESLWGGTFEDEVTPKVTFNKMGLLAMANAGPSTNGSQFFITTVATPWLNGKHTIFGEVVKGYDAVQKIENTSVAAGDRPVSEQKIIKATLKSAE
ncbi:MAG: peptidylprolyl isomerase [Candidatus Omnitrophica bacterium]|nr:peptidylprolyl isomerase [Candidatus Omnitrophota bacterium]